MLAEAVSGRERNKHRGTAEKGAWVLENSTVAKHGSFNAVATPDAIVPAEMRRHRAGSAQLTLKLTPCASGSSTP